MDVMGVRMEMPSNTPIVLLKEKSGDRYLPIWVGAVEATAIAYAQQGVVPPRPLTHDLLDAVLARLGGELVKIHVSDLKGDTFIGTIFVQTGGKVVDLEPNKPVLYTRHVVVGRGDTCCDLYDEFERFLDSLGITIGDFHLSVLTVIKAVVATRRDGAGQAAGFNRERVHERRRVYRVR